MKNISDTTESWDQHSLFNPYRDAETNLIYNLLFCDNLDLYKHIVKEPISYPWDILFSKSSSHSDIEKIINDDSLESRVRILACNRQIANGVKPEKKELLAVIIEIGLELGLDVLASFKDGTARYINQSGKLLIWETSDEISNLLTNALFSNSVNIINKIGPWDKPRRPYPEKDHLRITFLVTDGLYFGEGPIDALFNDPMASPALSSATKLMQYLTKKTVDAK